MQEIFRAFVVSIQTQSWVKLDKKTHGDHVEATLSQVQRDGGGQKSLLNSEYAFMIKVFWTECWLDCLRAEVLEETR